ncbi:MAG: Gfo/Idh/MocA family oxidoreductase [Verrucomicrobiales bacterium]|jgi:predicted dehydrogenase|nr:Gfo/Idh/MocA family oxidoreductase [Verrucomicrobiales bacterium]
MKSFSFFPEQPNRRTFLKMTAGAGAALAIGNIPAFGINPEKNDALNIAIVGCGAQGRVLLEACMKIPNIRFVAVCDIWDYAREYARRFLKKAGHEPNAYTDIEDMLSKEKNLDGVLVAVPDFWHAPHTNMCLKAGINVYCEKMMSNTIAGARSMVETMKSTGKLLQIGHQRRSNPRYLVTLNRLIKEANITGRITAANAQWNRAVADDLGWPKNAALPAETLQKYGFKDMHVFRNWRWFREYGGGPLSDLGAHQIDIFNWFFGTAPTNVIGNGGVDYYTTHEWFDQAMVVYEYQTAQGVARAFYQVLTTTSAGGGYFEEFMGVDGTIKISENPNITSIFREARAPSWEPFIRQKLLAESIDTSAPKSSAKVDARETAALAAYKLPIVLNKAIHQPHLENFFAAIRGEAKLNCPADEAFASEIAVFKAIEAVDTKKLVTLTPEEAHV